MDNNWKKEFNDETEKQKVYTLVEARAREFYDLGLKGVCWVKIPPDIAEAVGYRTGDDVAAVIQPRTFDGMRTRIMVRVEVAGG